MQKFREIKPEEIDKNTFKMIGKDWMLVTAGTETKANTMTASWGGLGVMWGKNVAYVVIRPQRYTKEFIDAGEYFSLSFLDNGYRKVLSYLGSVSGRDEDKIEKSKVTVQREDGTPYIDEASTVLICKKLYAQDFEPECFVQQDLIERWYPGNDFHTMYIVEVVKVLVKD